MANRIHSKGSYVYDEAVAGEASIYPGMLLELNSDGEVIMHDTEGGRAEKAFAIEDALQGNTVDDAYAADDVVAYIIPVQGAEVNALLKAGYDYAIGDELISAADGTLKQATEISSGETVDDVVAVVTEAVDLTGSGAVDTLASVRVR